jgi:hypothetical protein
LPARADEDLAHRLFQPGVRIADHQPHAAQSPVDEPLQEGAPQHHVLTEPHIHAQHRAHAIGPHAVGDHHRHTLHPPRFPHVLVASIQPQTGVDGVEPALAEQAALLVQALGHAADLALGQAGDAQLLDQRLNLARAHALHIGLGHHGDQRLLAAAAWLQPTRKIAPAAQPGDRQLDRPQPRIPQAAPAAIALGHPLLGPFVAVRADLHAEFGLHQLLDKRPHRFPQEVISVLVYTLAQRLQDRHPVFGHRLLLSVHGRVHLHGNAPVALAVKGRDLHHLPGLYPW